MRPNDPSAAPAASAPSAATASLPTDLTACTATQLLRLYARGEASPVETTRAVLQRVARLNPALNAFCLVDGDAAEAAARLSEARWQRHRQALAQDQPEAEPIGALDGVPVSIKDLILTRGWPTLRGSRTVDPHQPWDTDAPATARLREAGAVLFGKTCTPEFGCKAETNSPLSGITRNPWHLGKTPGGSSGGAAAAVSAGLGPLALGTDGAGSVRVPAAFCGNVGFKPSFGRVPAYPLSPFGSVAHLGPHAMSVADAALMMNVLKRPDARDWTSLPFDGADYMLGLAGSDDLEDQCVEPDAALHGLRIAFSPTLGYARGVDAEVAAAVAQAVGRLQAAGAVVEAVDPGFEDPLDITTGLWFVGAWTVWSGLSAAQQAQADPDFRAQAERGARFSALDIQRLHLRRGELGSRLRQFMQRFDLIATPSVAVPAFDALPAGHRPMDEQAMLGWTPFSYPFNLSQQPACSIPCGLTRDGLPIGLQLVGPMFGDAQVLRAAAAFEALSPIPRPPMTWAMAESAKAAPPVGAR